MFVLLFVIFGSATATYINGEQEDWLPKLAPRQYYSPRTANTCPSNTQCTSLSSCPMLANIMNHECINSERAGILGCGRPGSGLVCCPSNYGHPVAPGSGGTNRNHPDANIPGGGDEQKCGKSMVQGDAYNGIGAYPWVVMIGFRNSHTGEMKYPCAGSILSKRVVLTAGHCALAKAENYKLHSVRVGEYRTDSTLDCGDTFCALPVQDIAISHVIVHPGYEQQTFKNDVALIILRSDINFTITAQPICLVQEWSQPRSEGILVGWGKAAGQQSRQAYQQVIELPVVNLRMCVEVYGRNIPITEDHICAGGQFGKDACEGFGGAPLVVRHDNVYYQIGILSFGSNRCGSAGVPSVYTSIKRFSRWIKENTPVVYTN